MAEVDFGSDHTSSFFIADLVKTLSKLESATQLVSISSHQLRELQLNACAKFSGQSNLIESIGSLFCICIHCALRAKFNNSEDLVSCTLLLECIASECLAVIRTDLSDIIYSNGGCIHIANPQTVLSSEITRSQIKRDMNILFVRAFCLAKEILTNIAQLLLPSSDKLQQTSKDLKDCVSVHTIYFMCCFGLSHIGISLEGSKGISSVPGLCEILIVTSLCSFSPGEVEVETQRQLESHRPQRSGVVLKSRFKDCMAQARLLSIAVLTKVCCKRYTHSPLLMCPIIVFGISPPESVFHTVRHD